MVAIHPVILAGGSGTRLWPLSRKSYPKQFTRLISDTSLFQSSAERLTSSEFVRFEPHTIMTNPNFRFIIEEQLQELGLKPGSILIEPESKNTAAAILASSISLHAKDKNAIVLVAPSDHVIPDKEQFHKAIAVGLPYLKLGKMVTFGIKPKHAETGYGYLELSSTNSDNYGTSDVVSFVEKPDLKNAEKMLNAGLFLWNSGIFLFNAEDMIDAFRIYYPNTLQQVKNAVINALPDLGFLRLAKDPWSALENISIDYAIMEKASNLVAVPYLSKWSDLGGWDAIWSESNPDSSGNVTSKFANMIDCSNSLLRSESVGLQVVGIGLDNIIAIAMTDAVLIANKDRAQDVKKAVALLKRNEIDQADSFPKDHRPWGWFEKLSIGERFQVKYIHVKPGGTLSLQSHNKRSEHWVVVEGTAKVTIDDNVKLVSEGQSVYVPLGAKHRLENPGKLPIVLIEVQIGTYLGEDDIIRYEDVYARN